MLTQFSDHINDQQINQQKWFAIPIPLCFSEIIFIWLGFSEL